MTDNQSPAPANRRRCRRLPPKGGTRPTCIKGGLGLGKNLALSVLDLSEEGIRLLLTEPLEVGQEVTINLESVNRPRPLQILGKVVWAVPAADGSCCIGVRFERTLAYADMNAFIRV